MAAFDKVKSGIDGMDHMLDYIRMGDSVLWQVSVFEEYKFVVDPFVGQAVADGRKLIYMRFANHDPLVEPREGVKIYEFDPKEGFETFTIAVRKVIAKEGREAMYVFDSLSNLQVQWSTALMIGNFFQVTIPYLFEMNTVAYFPVTRGEHSHEAAARIHQTSQVLIDVYSGFGEIYMKPFKVRDRKSEQMFLPHHYNRKTGAFDVLTDDIGISRFYQMVDQKTNQKNRDLDSWDRFVMWAQLEHSRGRCTMATRKILCENMMSRDVHVKRMLLKHYTPEDYFLLHNRIIGSGGIGGKACGMLLARKLIQVYLPELYSKLEPHDSFYVGSDVFYSYIVHNGYWHQRIAQKTRDGYFTMADELRECFVNGQFPPDVRRQFVRMLEYFGQNPIIVRSSSLQEDGYGNAFAGKYESVFCINTGTIEEQLEALEDAVRTVYASAMDRSALEYRRLRGLEESDEQMAILIQRVSGSKYDDFFMPSAAGVGYSYSAYRWDSRMDPDAGMLRMVVGLGTQAVDRTGSYPRIISLDRPEKSPLTNTAERHKFSQNKLDVLDYNTHTLRGRRINTIQDMLPKWYKDMMFEHDIEAENMYMERGERREVLFASCHGLVKNKDFIAALKSILAMLQEQYKYPVDIEFTVNATEDGEYVLNLLQCRPLQIGMNQGKVKIPTLKAEHIMYDVKGSSMGGSRRMKLDWVICVNPMNYYRFPYGRKHEISHGLGAINAYFKEHEPEAKIMLMVPGRIGTSSPDLGVPVSFADITQFGAICEISDSSTGYVPELSYGSHMFQDLVEAGKFYTALFENESTRLFERSFFADYENMLSKLVPELADYEDIIRVRDTRGKSLMLYSDVLNERTLCGYNPRGKHHP